MSNNTLFCCS